MSDYLETSAENVPVKETDARTEGHWHSYVSSRIPWYVRLMWLMFWVFAVYYTITYLFPTMQIEIVTPP